MLSQAQETATAVILAVPVHPFASVIWIACTPSHKLLNYPVVKKGIPSIEYVKGGVPVFSVVVHETEPLQ